MLISFAAFTGCRVGEILGAAWSHIDWETGQFHVRRTFKEGRFQEPKTRTSYRRLSLPTFLLKELKVWRLACPNSPYDLIFPNLDGQPMSHSNLMRRGFHAALKRAGIRRIRFHDLRHVRVSRLMGHSTASFTPNVYSHMLPREHDPSGDRLASLVFGNKMETVANLPSRLERPSAENLSKSA